MKVTAVKKELDFIPFSISIEFETGAEAAQFYSIFNHVRIIDTTVGIDAANRIRQAIKEGNDGKIPEQGLAGACHYRLNDLMKY